MKTTSTLRALGIALKSTALLLGFCCSGLGFAQAQTTIAHWNFDANPPTASTSSIAQSTSMRITEYMYSGADEEFVEFTNVGSMPVDMTGWSYDDDSRTPGGFDLSGFGTVQPGESVIITEGGAAAFRTAWALCDAVKVLGGYPNNLGRNDEINLYDQNNILVDRLTYGDQDFPGSIRTQNASGWVSAAGLGANDISEWTLATVGDAEGSSTSTNGDIGSPGKSTRATVAFDPCLPAIRITEYMYSGADEEFVEFTNVGSTPVDMTGWSYDDDSRTPGGFDLSGFGTVQPGESVIITEGGAAAFRTAWALCDAVKVLGGYPNNLGRNDEINLYDQNDNLVDRLTYGDQDFPGSIRTQNASGWVSAAGLGANDISEWTLSTVGDAEDSYASTNGDIGSPGKSTRATVAFDPCADVDPCDVSNLSASIALPASQGNSFLITPLSQLSVTGAEVLAYDADSKRLFSNNGPNGQVDIIDFSDPENPMVIGSIGMLNGPNSVAVKNGIVAIADADGQNPGRVVFTDINGNVLNTVTVGALPDMLIFTPDGSKVLTANEGEPNAAYTVDPEGSVSIIDLSGGVVSASVTTASFVAFNGQEAVLRAQGIRIFGPGASVAQDLEPEYITISEDGATAYVALQENNAIATVDIATATVVDISPLGFKDHSLAGNGLDASNRDVDGTSGGGGKINIQNWPILGMYQPDGMTSYTVNGETYLITANEGDARDYAAFSEEVRVGSGSYVLDPTAFPNAAMLKQDENLGRLNVTTALGDTDSDTDFDQIYAYGARSFSIWRASDISQVYDSGDDFERITADLVPEIFNSEGTPSGFDSRSDNKGPEPEAVKLLTLQGRTYAFIALERISGLMVYEVSDPFAPVFVTYVPAQAGDFAPEDLLLIEAADSPNGEILIVVANEASNTISTYSLQPGCTDALTLTGNAQGGTGSYTSHQWQITGGTAVGASLLDADQPSATLDLSGLTVAGSLELSYTVTDSDDCSDTGTAMTVVEPCFSISGSIVWEYDGSTPVPDAEVSLSGDDSGSGNTDVDGDYAIPTVGGNSLTLRPSKTTGDPYEGVDVADVTRIQQHVTFIDRFDDGYKAIAADVNLSNSVTGLDAAVVFHAINGNPSAQAIFETPSWRFVDAAHTFGDENSPWPFPDTIELMNVMADVLNQNFVGVKMGDVNGTWATSMPLTSPPLNLMVQDVALKTGQRIRIPFRANGRADVAAWQFALHFDTDYLRFERALPTAAFPLKDENFGAWQADAGELRSVFAVPQGLALPKDEVIFELEFQALHSGLRLSEVLRLAEDVLPGRVYNTALNGGAVALTFEVVETQRIASLLPGEAALGFALEQNMPNPFSGETLIRFELPEAGDAVFSVHDVQGRLLYEQQGFFDAGSHEVRLDAARWGATGVLSYTLRTGAHSATRRMVVVR